LGIAAVNFDRMRQALLRDVHGAENQLVYWSQLADGKTQLLTPNTDALYILPFVNTRQAGPMVLDIPPADDGTIVGSIMDCWQIPLEDVGPAGADQGNGGRYLVLPPGYGGEIPGGYIVLPSANYTGYALLRSIPASSRPDDIAKAAAYLKRIGLYPLAEASHPPESAFLDAADVVFDAAIPYDLRFFESLDRMVQDEPWLERDRVMIDILRSAGIVKGRPFSPGPASAEMLSTAAAARDWFDVRYEDFPAFFPGTRWTFPVDMSMMRGAVSGFTSPDEYPVDARGLTYYWGFSSIKRAGGNQLYLFATRDRDGQALDGGRTYRLNVPAHVPASQYWSATAYNRATHTLIRDVDYASRSSLTPELATNPDATVDIYFGPHPPESKQQNWIPTRTGEQFEIIFRFYGVQKPVLDKTWTLPDIEPASNP
jgi:hypothetical protein